jgi:anti-sigma factor (TIGR02949 family)
MTSNYENNCGWVLDRIEPYLDEDLSPSDLERFERHVDKCETCAAELRFATRVVDELRSLPTLTAPQTVGVGAAPEGGASLLDRIAAALSGAWASARRPAMAAMLVVIAAVGVFVISQRRSTPPATTTANVSEEEIEQAARETMLAFAYVGKYSRMTGNIIRDDVIGGYVVEPVERAFKESRIIETKPKDKRSGT